MSSDSIVKSTVLRAPIERVWKALSDSAQFGAWFGIRVDGPFEPGKKVRAVVVPTTVDPEVAEMQKAYEGVAFELAVEQVVPQRLFSFRWTHPDERGNAPTTLVEFALEQEHDGVRLTVTESGFDNIPLERRAKIFSENEQGWAIQMRLIGAYLAAHR